jgi:glycine dehydrogenase
MTTTFHVTRGPLEFTDTFVRRHIGPAQEDALAMLGTLGLSSMEALVAKTVPSDITFRKKLDLGPPKGEHEMLVEARRLADMNEVWRSYIGMGYSGTITPSVIQRNILENPGWYTQYTPYQAEISQGRLEALLNFQTMIIDLTGLDVANASMLDESTAAAEAMTLLHRVNASAKAERFFIANDCHPQTIDVVKTRAHPLGIEVVVGDPSTFDFASGGFGALLQYPGTDGVVRDLRPTIARAHDAGVLVAVACDLLSLVLLESPGALGADIALGNSQRFGVPMGYGGPHAAFFATKDAYKRQMPGRLIGVSKDATGRAAMRLTLQTREQHIRREKATSNICTAQVLLAIMASMYAVYHGPEGLRRIAERVHNLANALRGGLAKLGLDVDSSPLFDTVRVKVKGAARDAILKRASDVRINLRALDDQTFAVALDETTSAADIADLYAVFSGKPAAFTPESVVGDTAQALPKEFARQGEILAHPIFHLYRSETEILRYMHRLQAKDLSLTTSMIPLGSCTMKLNATTEMYPVSYPGFSSLHPFAPVEQAKGYHEMFRTLERMLAEITGLPGVSLQPNAGSAGEYTGLLVVRAFHESKGNGHRNICLIPSSAHGTNPASATMAGFDVVVVKCDDEGNIDLADLDAKIAANKDKVGAIMVTYPSTHGVFESTIRAITTKVHAAGGQVYLDGANMNAQVGLCRPGDFGADVIHLNLHKTFCIPHGGGGPGMGPICTAAHLSPFLPGHPVIKTGGEKAIGAVAGAPWSSASILPISWMYIALMGDRIVDATSYAILNANYMAKRLETHYPILYRGQNGLVAHEFILNCKSFQDSAGVTVEDIAKRLMDYGFHAPTMSWPVAATLMIEPTESESKAELDRLCDALIAIKGEIEKVASGAWPKDDNPLKNAPHTAEGLLSSTWTHPYTREEAAYPAPWTRVHKYWPPVSRVDNVYGDRNIVCACPPIEEYMR